MKKKIKVKKQTDKEIIKTLRADLAQAVEEYSIKSKYAESLDLQIKDVKKKVNRLFGESEGDFGEWPIRIADFPAKIEGLLAQIEAHKYQRGAILPWIDQNVENTHAKLWYLLRVAMKDETLKPVPYEDPMRGPGVDPFNRPRFNQ